MKVNSHKSIILDTGIVKKKGKKYFLNSRDWPVSEDQFRGFVNLIFNEYIKNLKLQKGALYSLSLIEIRFINRLINIFHYNYVVNYSKIKNIRIEYTGLSNDFLFPNWNTIGNFYNSFNYPYNKIQRMLRKIIKAFLFNRHLIIFKILIGFISGKN